MADDPVTPEAEAPDTGTPETPKAEEPTTPESDGKEPPQADPAPADPAADTPEEPETAEVEWPEDWREKLAKDDAKALNRLKRFASPENLVRTLMEQDRKISSGEYKKGLGDNPSEEEIAAYRKANGIPEEATAEGYGVDFPENFEASDADKAELGEFLKAMHDQNASPAVVKSAWDTYLGMREKAEQDAYDVAQQRTQDYKVELKTEYGKDYDRNTRIGDNFLASQLGENASDLTGLTLADGTKLGDNPNFVRFIVNAGLNAADDEAVATAELDGGQSIEDAYKTAMDLKFTDPKKYHSDEHQQKLMRLAAARSRAA